MTLDRNTVLAALRAEDVAEHVGIKGQWRGLWMRSSRCATADHASDAFGISQRGFWHCHACDTGGDLLDLIARSEGLDLKADFPKVLKVAAAIAGVSDEADDWGALPAKPAPRPRPALPELKPLSERVAIARKRAAWVWSRLLSWNDVSYQRADGTTRSTADSYLALSRKLDPHAIRQQEELRETPMRCSIEEAVKSADLKSLKYTFGVPGIALPVRSVSDGHLVDIRIRRYEPRDGQPKIVGMLGGVTVGPAEAGKPRTLIGCYGHPESVDSDLVVIVEGAMDYLTALCLWPNARVLGAVDAGSLALVTAHAARQLAGRDKESKILIVEQDDGAGAAADRSVNEDPNAATKVAIRILGPRRLEWLFCDTRGQMAHGGKDVPAKDLNDLVQAGANVKEMVSRWPELGVVE